MAETAFSVGAGAAIAGEAPKADSPVLIVRAEDGAVASFTDWTAGDGKINGSVSKSKLCASIIDNNETECNPPYTLKNESKQSFSFQYQQKTLENSKL